VFVALLLAGCGDSGREHIKWQLPLEAPADQHGSEHMASELPAWAANRQGSVEIRMLEKSSTQLFEGRIAMNGKVRLRDLEIRLLGLAQGLRMKSGTFIDDDNVHNAAAFVEISREGRQVYRGWLYQEFPEMFGPDTPDWKVWLKSVSLQPPFSREGNVEKS